MRVITEAELRVNHSKNQDKQIYLNKDDFLTQTAKDYIREKKLTIIYDDIKDYELMSKEIIAEDVKYRYFDIDGNAYENKPEHMTQLNSNILVFKNHPRIIFRGKLDTLQGKILEAQLIAYKNGKSEIVDDLNNILNLARDILASEVKEEPLKDQLILGLNADELRERSHNPNKYYGVQHFVPNYKMGEVLIALNSVRTAVRETELSSINAFMDEDRKVERPDLIKTLNRMSSAIYIISCKALSNR